jgi:hypothetical protein
MLLLSWEGRGEEKRKGKGRFCLWDVRRRDEREQREG